MRITIISLYTKRRWSYTIW